MRILFALLVLVMSFAASSRLTGMARADAGQRGAADDHVVACRVLEAHAAAWPEVTIILFHQQQNEDQARLGSLLRAKSGAQVGVKLAGGDWKPATVVRLKNCFGRGLLLFPAAGPAPKDGESFLIKFPSEKDSE